MDCSTPGLPVHCQLLEFTQTHIHWVSDAIQPSHPLSSPSQPSIFPSIRIFSNELVLHIRWPKYWSFSFNISPSNEYSGQISLTSGSGKRRDFFQSPFILLWSFFPPKVLAHFPGYPNSYSVTWLPPFQVVPIFLDCVCVCEVAQSRPTLCDPVDCSPPGSSVHGVSPGKNTGVGCHFLLQRIFPTQGLNLGLLHCRQMLYPLSHQGSHFIFLDSSSVQFIRSVVSNSLPPHELQHTRPPCPSPSPRVH